MRDFMMADLFCGAGGTSTGAIQACEAAGLRPRMVAVNHWPTAVESHAANHPSAEHHCVALENLSPRQAVPGGKLDILWASPTCTHHSRARGGRPMNEQLRASPQLVTKWMEELDVNTVVIENVPEFVEWGPIDQDGNRIKNKKGNLFRPWLSFIRALGYRLHWRLLTAADYGDATSRKRFILIAQKGRRPPPWPVITHGQSLDEGDMFAKDLRPWRSAAEIIDWSIPCPSIFMTQKEATAWARENGRGTPKRPLAEKTMDRIGRGIQQFVIGQREPFLVMPGHGCPRFRGQSLDEPLLTQGTSNRFALVQPWVMPIDNRSSSAPGSGIAAPLSTVVTKGRHALCAAWLMRYFGTSTGIDLREPHPTILRSPGHSALCAAFLTKYYGGGGGAQGMDTPLDTATCKARFGLATVMIEGEPWQIVDIGMRMLTPRELAAAHSFPSTYHFAGNIEDQVAQIGNSVPVRMARAICAAQLGVA